MIMLMVPASMCVQITLIGLLLVGFSHLLFALYCPFLDGDAPAWLFVLAAAALFAYQVRCVVLSA